MTLRCAVAGQVINDARRKIPKHALGQFPLSLIDMTSDPWQPREWTLDPETEYRFELEPGATISATACLFTL